MASSVPIQDSAASLAGKEYEVANGESIVNLGEKRCLLQNEGGSEKLLTLQVCDVHKPLLSVSKLCGSGHAVGFHPEWSFIENLATGERMTLEQKNGLYELKAWVKGAPGSRQGFTRPGR